MTFDGHQYVDPVISRNAQVATNLRVGIDALVTLQSGRIANYFRQILKGREFHYAPWSSGTAPANSRSMYRYPSAARSSRLLSSIFW